MAMPLAVKPGNVGVIEVEGELISKPYVEITINLMRKFGIDVSRRGWQRFEVSNANYRSPGEMFVEGDASSASYFLAAGAIAGGPVRVQGVGRGSIQGDVRFVEVLERMGASVALGDDWIEVSGSGKLRAFDLDLNHIPDAAMTAAVLALFAFGRAPADGLLEQIGLHAQVAPSHDVVQHAHALEQGDVLKGAGDARGGGVVRAHLLACRALVGDDAVLRMVESVDDVEHRRLARAIGADDGADFAFADVERHIADRAHAAERQRYAFDCQ